MIAPQAIPATMFDLYHLNLKEVQRLDDSGEFCRYCQVEDTYVQVQAYATNAETGEAVMVSSCCTCLGQALFLADANMLETVTVEYQRANPVQVDAA